MIAELYTTCSNFWYQTIILRVCHIYKLTDEEDNKTEAWEYSGKPLKGQDQLVWNWLHEPFQAK